MNTKGKKKKMGVTQETFYQKIARLKLATFQQQQHYLGR